MSNEERERGRNLEFRISQFIANHPLNYNEYIKDNRIYCKNCKGLCIEISPDKTHIVHINCSCEADRIKKEEKEKKEQEKMKKYNSLIQNSLLGERFKNVSFDNIDTNRPTSFINALERCKRFCENWDQIKEEGQGIYLYGDYGTGKTHLTACIGKELLSKNIPVVFTSFIEVSKQLRDIYSNAGHETESSLIYKLTNVDLLVIDDIGAEILKKNGQDNFMQEKIYDIVNRRYYNKKPIIFSSNYSIAELLEKRGMEQRTVDRIAEMSTVRLKLEGESYRMIMAKKNKPLF